MIQIPPDLLDHGYNEYKEVAAKVLRFLEHGPRDGSFRSFELFVYLSLPLCTILMIVRSPPLVLLL